MRGLLEAELSDRYTIERELGRGGMASVWLARDRRHERLVAIKILHPELAGAIGVDRFVREVRLTARLQHPGIVPVFDSGILQTAERPLPWYAMAYVAGESLRTRLTRDTQLPIDDALAIVRELATALYAAHAQGVVHRDIKPENILLADGRAYLLDFGISKALSETGDERLTSTGIALGTPTYMSPEQASAERVDARTDQYSLATVLYEMLVGEPPVTGPSAQVILARQLTEPIRPIRSVRPAVPPAVEAAVLRALERVPADRFPDVAAFIASLGATTAALPTPAGAARHTRWKLGVAVVAVIFGGWIAVQQLSVPSRPSVDPEVLALVQRGVRASGQRTPEAAADAITAFKSAIARDSTYARAWAGLARAYVFAELRRFVFPGVAADSVLRLGVAAADRALAFDTTDAEVWVAQAVVRQRIHPTDVSFSIRAARRAIALDSLNGPAWHYLGLGLAESGQMAQAIDAWRHAVRASPAYAEGVAFLAMGHYWRRQYDSAAVWADSANALDPAWLLGWTTVGYVAIERGNYVRAVDAFETGRRLTTDVEIPNTLAGRALAEARAGQGAEARATLRLADSLARGYQPTPSHTAVYLAQAYAALGNAERAIWWLRQFPRQREQHYQLHIRCDPPLAPLANEPRFRALVLATGGC